MVICISCISVLIRLVYAMPLSLYSIKMVNMFYEVFITILQVPNTVEFADWIGRTKQKEIRVTV